VRGAQGSAWQPQSATGAAEQPQSAAGAAIIGAACIIGACMTGASIGAAITGATDGSVITEPMSCADAKQGRVHTPTIAATKNFNMEIPRSTDWLFARTEDKQIWKATNARTTSF
jgi:hypothetical protein